MLHIFANTLTFIFVYRDTRNIMGMHFLNTHRFHFVFTGKRCNTLMVVGNGG